VAGVYAYNILTGVRRVYNTDSNTIVDVIPADIVSNCLIVGSAHTASQPNSQFSLFHATTGVENPVPIIDFFNYGLEYLKYHPSEL